MLFIPEVNRTRLINIIFFTQVIVFLCAAGIASAGNLLHAAPITSYAAPAVSYQTISTHGAPAYTSYSTGPVVAKAISPAISYSSVAHSAPLTYATSPVAYSAAPAVSYSSVAQSAPLAYVSNPYVTKTLASPAVSYSSVANHGARVTYASSPLITKSIAAPAYTTYAAAAPAYSTYSTAPVLKSAIAYSAAPAVSHVTYTGLGASYGW